MLWKLWFNICIFIDKIHNRLFLKLEKYEKEIIIQLIKDNKDKCIFNYEYTIWKLENYLSKRR